MQSGGLVGWSSGPGRLTTSYAYDDANRLATTMFANGAVETKTYASTTKDLSSVVHVKSGTTLSSHTYTYDSEGKRLTETLPGSVVITYGYDDADQLTSESKSGGAYSLTYTYDNAGNRATKYNGTITETYAYDNAEKFTGVTWSGGSKSYSYDNAGNCTSVTNGGTTTYLTWDAESRLKTVAVGGSTVTTNAYNIPFASNHRRSRQRYRST